MTPRGAPPVTHQVQLLAASASLVAYLIQFLFPTVAVTIAHELSVPFAKVLSWSFGGYLLFGLGALPGAYLADRIGARRALLVGLAGTGVAALAVAEAVPGRSLALCLGALGLFAGFHPPAAMRLLARLDGEGQARQQRLQRLAGAIGLSLAPAVATALVQSYGTRQAYTIVGFAACALAAGLGMWRIDADDDPPIVLPDRTHHDRALAARGLLIATTAVAGLGFQVLVVFVPQCFALGASTLNFGLLASLVYLLALVGWPVGERLLRRRNARALALLVQGVSLLPLLVLGHAGGALLIVVALAAVLCGVGLQPIHMQLFVHVAPPPRAAMAYAVRFAAVAAVSSLAVPLIAWSAGNPSMLFDVVALLTAISAGALVLVRWERPAAEIDGQTIAARKPTVAVGEPVG
ncbi:MAG TPA: MFS transporter [Candidatus Kryptonia bacterium]|nr:MFS transporter [Candidatus Kryptonia bacterium]